jgi:hypothetical protein
MITRDEIEINGKMFVKTYSDSFIIRKVGTDELYDIAFDPIKFKDERIYEETDNVLPEESIHFIQEEILKNKEQETESLSSEIQLEENTEEMI